MIGVSSTKSVYNVGGCPFKVMQIEFMNKYVL